MSTHSARHQPDAFFLFKQVAPQLRTNALSPITSVQVSILPADMPEGTALCCFPSTSQSQGFGMHCVAGEKASQREGWWIGKPTSL
mmetsp:Transcript_25152/g.51107  ORF Transcript_25152/g.51107 Transcript_25152/m.51107 type:complete len:86 (+) Transcript_25152:99-356(+)